MVNQADGYRLFNPLKFQAETCGAPLSTTLEDAVFLALVMAVFSIMIFQYRVLGSDTM